MCSVSKKCRQGHCDAGFFGYRVWDHLLATPSKSAERHQLATYLLSWSDEVHQKKTKTSWRCGAAHRASARASPAVTRVPRPIECICDLLLDAILSDLEGEGCVEDGEVSGRREGLVCLR